MAADRPSIRYETPAPKVARIWLARAAQDDDVSVIVLAAEGPHLSSGHDLRERDGLTAVRDRRTVGTWCGFGCAGAEARMAREKEIYLGFSERWRNIPKPTVAAVHGKCIAGGLMLVWPCDIIVAAEDAELIDNTVAMGVCGAEFFHHPWEVGVRRAKEMLDTSDAVSAADAHRVGMVNHVVPRDALDGFTLDLATRIAQRPLFALELTKEAVNAAQDAQGRVQPWGRPSPSTSRASHNQQVHGMPIDPSFQMATSANRR